MAVRTFSIKFLGEVADFQKKARQAKSSLEEIQKAATSPGFTNSMANLVNVGDRLKNAGGKMQATGGQISRYITAPVVGAVGAVAGLTGALGFKRLVGIDTARAQFKGLGYDADQVMKQVDVGVTNTALSMADGAALATGILATGAVPMDKLNESIKRVANVSAAYGVEGTQAGNLLNKVLTKNKVTYGDLSQMQENGIPIISDLAKHYGVAGDQIEKMARDGKISIEDFNKVLDKGSGKAAAEYAKSWKGITANIKSNLGKIGAKALGAGFEVVKEQAASVLELLRSKDLSSWAETVGTQIGQYLSGLIDRVKTLIGWWDGLSAGSKKFVGAMAGVAVAFGPALIMAGRFVSFIGTAMIVVPKIIAVLGLISAPVALWVVGITAVVAAMTWFFTKTELGRGIVEKAWAGIKVAVAAVTQWWTSTAAPALVGVWDRIKAAASAVADWWVTTAAPALMGGWDRIKAAAAAVADWYTGTLQPIFKAVWGAIKDTASSAAAWYQDHVAPVFQAFGELVQAVMENWVAPAMAFLGRLWEANAILMAQIWNSKIKPVLDFLGEAWQVTWILIKGAWDKIGPPLVRYIQGTFDGMKIVLATIWDSIKIIVETVLGVIKGVINTATALIKGDWEGAWKAVKETFATQWDGTRKLIERVVGGVRDWLGNVWTTIKDMAKLSWQGVSDSVMAVINPLRDKIVGAFDAAKDGIGKALNLVKAAAAVPINFVINTVWNDGLRAVINAIPGVPDVARVAPIPGYDRGGWTGPGHKFKPAGIVHADEYVFTKDEVRQMGGPQGVEAWKRGVLPGYAGGGRVKPVASGISGNTYARHTGLDFPMPMGSPVRATYDGTITRTANLGGASYGRYIDQLLANGLRARYAHLSATLVNQGQPVKGGQVIGRVGSTGRSSGPHLHFEAGAALGRTSTVGSTRAWLNGSTVMAGGAAGAGLAGAFAPSPQAAALAELPGKITGILGSIKSGLTGPWGGLVKDGMLSAVSSAKDWMLKQLTGSSTISRGTSTLGDQFKRYAVGVRYAPKRPFWAGESGPELIMPAGGERVVPHRQSMDLAAQVVGRSTNTGRTQSDVDALFERMITAMETWEPTVNMSIDEGDIRRVVRAELRTQKTGA